MERELKLKSSDLEWVSGGDETVILDDASEQYFATNSAGSLLWEALKDGATHSELTGLLVDAFDLDGSRAQADVTSFVAELDELGMLE